MADLDWNAGWSTASVYERTVQRFREARIVLPTFAELADPGTIPERGQAPASPRVDPDAPIR